MACGLFTWPEAWPGGCPGSVGYRGRRRGSKKGEMETRVSLDLEHLFPWDQTQC